MAHAQEPHERPLPVWLHTGGRYCKRAARPSGESRDDPRFGPQLCEHLHCKLKAALPAGPLLPANAVSGLLVLRTRQKYAGVMTALTDIEHILMADACWRKKDFSAAFLETLHSFDILAAWPLPEPELAVAVEADPLQPPRATLFRLTEVQAMNLGRQQIGGSSLREVLGQCLEEDVAHMPTLAMNVSQTVGCHFLSGVWNQCCLSKHCSGSQLEARMWRVWRPAPSPTPSLDAFQNQFGATPCCVAADVLRLCAGELRARGGGLPAGVSEAVQWLELMAVAAKSTDIQEPRRKYETDMLIQTVLLSRLLKKADDLQEVFMVALRTTLPAEIANHYIAQLQDKSIKVPSRSTIYRHQLTVHVGYLLMKQKEHAMAATLGAHSFLFTVDSSPQGGRDWVLIGMTCLKDAELPGILKRIHYQHRAAGAEGAADAQASKDNLEALAMVLQTEGLSPVAVGSRRCSVPHKLHAVLHAVFINFGTWHMVAEVMRCVTSWTCDMGTERLFQRFPKTRLQTLFPWITSDTIHDDKEAREDPLVFAGEAGEAARAEHRDEALVFAGEGDAQICEASISEPGLGSLEVDLGRSLYTAGVLHIIHNATANLSDSLKLWKWFIGRLTIVCRMLSRPWWRQRLLQTCFEKHPASLLKDKIEGVAGTDLHVDEGR